MPIEIIANQELISVIEPEANVLTVKAPFSPNYGSFDYRGADQTWTTTAAMQLNYTDFSRYVSIVDNSKITIAKTGKYNIAFSAQLLKLTGGSHSVEIWLAKNGTAVAHSNTVLSISGGSNTALVAAWNWFVEADANDYFEIIWWVDAANTVKIDSRAVTSGRPEVPGLIVTVNQVG